MLYEIFYPKEMKRIINDLREKDDLNEGAAAHINKIIRVFLILFLALCLLIIVSEGLDGVLKVLILSIVCAVFLRFLIDHNFYKNMAPYLLGELKEGVIIDCKKYTYGFNPTPLFATTIKEIDKDRVFTIRLAKENQSSQIFEKLQPNDSFLFYGSENGRVGKMPAIKSIMDLHCLSASVLENKA